MKRCDILFAAALLFAFAGCDGSTSPEYRQERSDENYQRGINMRTAEGPIHDLLDPTPRITNFISKTKHPSL